MDQEFDLDNPTPEVVDDFGFSDDQIDSILAGNDFNPDTGKTQPPNVEQTTQQVPSSTKKFVHKGKEVEATEEQLIKWAQQGYDYGQLMNDFKQTQSQFDEKYGLYQKIDEYALQNPEWWENVRSSYGKLNQDPTQQLGDQQRNDSNDPLNIFKSELQELKQFKDDFIKEKEQAKAREEDQKLDNEINQVRQLYPDLGWNNVNNEGKTLELRVLEHAQKLGTHSFQAAFKDLMFDELLNKQTAKAKEETMKVIQRNQKIGLLGETPDPLKRYLDGGEVRNKSWDQLYDEAVLELGINED